jgi:hypothetical protein
MTVFVIPRTLETSNALLNASFKYTQVYKEALTSYLIQIYLSPEGNLIKEAHDTRIQPDITVENFYEVLTHLTLLEPNTFDAWLCQFLLGIKRLNSGYCRMS